MDIINFDSLYFAVVAHIMMHFANIYRKGTGITQEALVSRYVACVAKKLSECENQLLLGNDDDKNNERKLLNKGDKSKISRILTGKGNFKISSDFVGEITEEKFTVYTERFAIFLENEFEDKRILMLSLLHIIAVDESIRNNQKSFELFKKYIYRENGKYVFAELMVGILLYMIFNEKNDIKEKEYATSIYANLTHGLRGKNRYLSKISPIFNLIHEAGSHFANVKYSWNDDDNTLTFGDNNLFNEIFEKRMNKSADITASKAANIEEATLQNNSTMDMDAVFSYINKEWEEIISDPKFKKCYFCSHFKELGLEDIGFCLNFNATVAINRDDCQNFQRNDQAIGDFIVEYNGWNYGWRIK